ncbi:hypothetical protein [Methanolobus bombayensis]|uniref:hypothetical protein n=1 Tax=Methanolobus bombayensis TaxID=38023 RepID=UPI001AE18FA0|nr:hypothetical protein [Methanolobus bombayensis]MBP1908298.1 hypothetical protein [Methanolobus bombayensis]
MVLNTKTKNGMNYGACIVKRQDGSIRVKSPTLKELVRQNGDNNFVDTDGIITIKHDKIALCLKAIIDEHLDETMLTSILNILRMDYTEEHITTIEASEKVSKFVEAVREKPINDLSSWLSFYKSNNIQVTTYHYALDQVAAIVHAKRFTVDKIGFRFTKLERD